MQEVLALVILLSPIQGNEEAIDQEFAVKNGSKRENESQDKDRIKQHHDAILKFEQEIADSSTSNLDDDWYERHH